MGPEQGRPGRPAPADLAERRARLPTAPDPILYQPGVSVQETTLDKISCLEFTPVEARGTTLYFHGGGYRLGTAAAWAGLAVRLAAVSRTRVIVPNYSLAPENPFPAALYDGIAVYNAVMRGGREAPALAGDSAGGGLAVAVALATRLISFPMPKALVLLSPWLDLACPDYDIPGNAAANDPLFPRHAAQEAAEQYLQGHDPADPLASPLHGDLGGLPPVMLLASSAEYLFGDALAFLNRLARSNVPVQSLFQPGLQHAWPAIAPESPDSRAALAVIGQFYDGQFGGAAHG